jgi:thermostable 8-oxoguanine DNA glycosylase
MGELRRKNASFVVADRPSGPGPLNLRLGTSAPQLAGVVRGHAAAYGRFGAEIAPASPPTTLAVYERYLFAFLSRHCALTRTVRAFQSLRGCYQSDAAQLEEVLRTGRIGYHNTWPVQIAAFSRAYQDDPQRFLPDSGESFPDARDRISRAVLGLGPAKTSFALGLIYPFDASVCCIDTHIARLLALLMGCSPGAVPRRYAEAEAMLREVASAAGLPLVLAHWILWDHQRHGVGDCTRASACPLASPPGSESIRLISSLF